MATAQGLSESIEQRIRNQIGRAFRHTFGAEHGLRRLVCLATTQMLSTGTSRTTIRTTLARLVSDHPEAGGSKSSLVTGRSRVAALTASMMSWSDQTSGADTPE